MPALCLRPGHPPACTTGPLVLSGPPAVNPGATAFACLAAAAPAPATPSGCSRNIAGVAGPDDWHLHRRQHRWRKRHHRGERFRREHRQLTIPIKPVHPRTAAGAASHHAAAPLRRGARRTVPIHAHRYVRGAVLADSGPLVYVLAPVRTDTITVSDAKAPDREYRRHRWRQHH